MPAYLLLLILTAPVSAPPSGLQDPLQEAQRLRDKGQFVEEPSPPIDPSEAAEAARSLGFELVKSVPLPDGREARIWGLDREPS